MKAHKTEETLLRMSIEEAIKDNDGYCCCAIEKTEDTKCPCKEFREMQELGSCNCGLWVKTEL